MSVQDQDGDHVTPSRVGDDLGLGLTIPGHGTVDAFYFWPDLVIAVWLLLMLVEA